VIDKINVKNILEKEKPNQKNRSPFERAKLISYVFKIFSAFMKPNQETMPLFKEFVEIIVDERLHLKTYGTGAMILREDDSLDSLNIVLEGHVIQTKKDGTVIVHH
jgi:CRP-like cAMP-binding protein